jgi:hypothetical protein
MGRNAAEDHMSDFPTHIIRGIRHKAFGAEERFVLMVIADHMNKTSDRAWPSVGTIALITSYNERTVRRVITWLLSVGVLVEFDDNRASRTFGINFELLSSLPVALEPRASARTLVPGDRAVVPVNRTHVPVGPDRAAVPTPLSPSPDDRTLVPGGADPGTDKCIREEITEDPGKTQTAREATRGATVLPVPKKASRACQWPPDFAMTAEMIAYAVNRGMAGATQVADEFERFEHFHKSKGNKFVDWKLAFYNWVRNWEERRNKSARPAFPQQTRMSTMQTEPGVWDRRDDELAMEHG